MVIFNCVCGVVCVCVYVCMWCGVCACGVCVTLFIKNKQLSLTSFDYTGILVNLQKLFAPRVLKIS